MNPKWHPINRVARGGTVFDITIDSLGRVWIASPAGLFTGQNERWLPVQRSLPFVQVSAVLSIRKTLFAAGLPDGLVYSLDGGRSWYRAWTDQVQAPVTCFVVSPNFNKDSVLLAGTEGEGIIRTTDGGRHWNLSNFGLRGFSVYDLVAIGVPQTFRELRHLKEVVFAATDDGVYTSPNGGRAWKPAGTETTGMTILGLALSPNFATDQTLYAGTESGALFRSRDGGSSWRRLDFGGFSPGPINSLFCGGDGDLLVGTSQEGILRLSDRDVTWERVCSNGLPVLKLVQCGDHLYAGFYEGGLAVSGDGGETWEPVPDVAARRFEWLALPAADTFVAAGPAEGIWTSYDRGQNWVPAPGWPVEKTVLGLAAQDGVILAAAQDGVWRWTGTQDGWVQVLEADRISESSHTINTQFHLSSAEDRALGGGGNGGLWFSKDRGKNWEYLDTPFTGLPVIALAVSPYFGEDRTLVVSVADESNGQVQLWRSTDSGVSWSIWHSVGTRRFAARMAVSGKMAADTILGLGDGILHQGPNGWESSVISTESAPVSALAVLHESDLVVAAITDQVLFKTAEDPWVTFESMEGQAVIAMVRSPNYDEDRTLYALTSDGMLYEYIY
jgi:photosystem II stability/assembly factor-like uncharacterized protein